MLRWLRDKLTGARPDGSRPSPAPPRPTADRPAATAQTAGTDFLRREPLLDREHAVRGYELGLERPAMHRARHPAAQRFLDGALLDRLADERLAGILGRRLAFVPVSPASLDLAQLDRLAESGAGRLVVSLRQVPAGLDAAAATQLVARAQALKAAGLKLACGEALAGGPLDPLLELADYLDWDVAAVDPASLLERQRQLVRAHPGARLVARNVDTQETLEACRALAFHYFQGGYVTQQRAWPQPRVDASRMVVAQLIAQLRQDPENLAQVALLARLDPVLAFRLLRYVNSAAMGLRHKIASLEHAMTYIGREGLYRWLTMLLFYTGKTEPMDAALRETALARARLTELLAQSRLPRQQAEMAFITGLLSLMDVLFQMPLHDAVSQLGLPEEVLAALLRREGVHGDLLNLAVACEEGDQAGIAALAERCGLTPALVSARHLEALVWAVELTENMRSGGP
jgi:EAL and modified HD-GYP domain-containing signal transduction protein